MESVINSLLEKEPTTPSVEGELSGNEVAEEVGIRNATEEVADRREIEPNCEEVAKQEAERTATQGVAESSNGVRVEEDTCLLLMASDCNRFKIDLAPYVQIEPIQVPKESPKNIGAYENVVMTGLEVIPSSWSGFEKTEKLVRIFEEKIKLLREKGGEEETRLGDSGDEDAIVGGVIMAGGASQKAKKKKNKTKRKKGKKEKKVECRNCSTDDGSCVSDLVEEEECPRNCLCNLCWNSKMKELRERDGRIERIMERRGLREREVG